MELFVVVGVDENDIISPYGLKILSNSQDGRNEIFPKFSALRIEDKVFENL